MKSKSSGVVVTFNEDRGFGFIRQHNSEKLFHLFFHITSCSCVPTKGLEVQFNIGEGKKGPMAVDIDVLAILPGIEKLSGSAL